MLKIFLSSHGSMASGMQSSLKILMGECENLTVFDAYLDESCVQDHLDAFYETVGPEDEVLLCSDLYGGSVNPQNAQELIALPDVDGLFIGRSAWDASQFNRIIRQVMPLYMNK